MKMQINFKGLRPPDACFEGNVGILDESFGSEMAGIFEQDFSNSERIEEEEWHRRSFFEKISEHFFALFRKRL